MPEEASTGLTPHSAAKLASERSRAGLSPTVTISVLATWVATPTLGEQPPRGCVLDEFPRCGVEPGYLRGQCLVAAATEAIVALAPPAGPTSSCGPNRAAVSNLLREGEQRRRPGRADRALSGYRRSGSYQVTHVPASRPSRSPVSPDRRFVERTRGTRGQLRGEARLGPAAGRDSLNQGDCGSLKDNPVNTPRQ